MVLLGNEKEILASLENEKSLSAKRSVSLPLPC